MTKNEMIKNNKRHIYALGERIEKLKNDSNNYDLLIETQVYILKRILVTEKRKTKCRMDIAKLKRQLRRDRLPKDKAAAIKKQISCLELKIEQYQWLLYIWRCFGDAIAYIYMDKWAIKPFMYNASDTNIKQTAGYISGKKGLYHEFAVVLDAKKHNVPALLNDLTNTFRHGDVCLMGESDPYVIEVKSSENRNKRNERQYDSIATIHNYLKNDGAAYVRGMPNCVRLPVSVTEVNYISLVNEMLAEAMLQGISCREPEFGIRYCVIHARYDLNKLDNLFMDLISPMVFMLNEAKNDQVWDCYYPFVLSIQSHKHLYSFLKGDLFLMVIFDINKMITTALKDGIALTPLDEDSYTLQAKEISLNPKDAFLFKISDHLIRRVAFEFISWDWVFKWINRMGKNMKSSRGNKVLSKVIAWENIKRLL
jgi:hypothetical protein